MKRHFWSVLLVCLVAVCMITGGALTANGTQAKAVVKGDANGDGMVLANDAMLTLQYSIKAITKDKLNTAVCDMDGNGMILANDAMLILQKSIGMGPKEETYTVTFKDYDGTVLKEETVEEGAAATAPQAPVREGYTFTGWDKVFDAVISNLTVTAQYEQNAPEVVTYQVTFKDYDGTVLKEETVEEGAAATAPQAPSREGYTFTGWDKSFDSVTADLTVTAQYEQIVSTGPMISVTGTIANAGATGVEVAISVKNNPGILGMTLTLTYDESALTLKKATNGAAMEALVMTPPGKLVSGGNFVWDAMDLTEEQIQDGEILILVFDIADTAASGKYPLQLSYTNGDIFDCDFNDLVIDLQDGAISVS